MWCWCCISLHGREESGGKEEGGIKREEGEGGRKREEGEGGMKREEGGREMKRVEGEG